MNLYGFVGNDGINKWDYLGLKKIGKDAGADALVAVKAKLNEILELNECVCADDDMTKDAINELTLKLVEMWLYNFIDPFDSPDGYESKDDRVGCHYCWDWAQAFYELTNLIKNKYEGSGLCVASFRQFQAAPRANGNIPDHWAVKICIGDCKNSKCCITIDDGFFQNGLVHDNGWPNRPDYTEVSPELDNKGNIDYENRDNRFPVILPEIPSLPLSWIPFHLLPDHLHPDYRIPLNWIPFTPTPSR